MIRRPPPPACRGAASSGRGRRPARSRPCPPSHAVIVPSAALNALVNKHSPAVNFFTPALSAVRRAGLSPPARRAGLGVGSPTPRRPLSAARMPRSTGTGLGVGSPTPRQPHTGLSCVGMAALGARARVAHAAATARGVRNTPAPLRRGAPLPPLAPPRRRARAARRPACLAVAPRKTLWLASAFGPFCAPTCPHSAAAQFSPLKNFVVETQLRSGQHTARVGARSLALRALWRAKRKLPRDDLPATRPAEHCPAHAKAGLPLPASAVVGAFAARDPAARGASPDRRRGSCNLRCVVSGARQTWGSRPLSLLSHPLSADAHAAMRTAAADYKEPPGPIRNLQQIVRPGTSSPVWAAHLLFPVAAPLSRSVSAARRRRGDGCDRGLHGALTGPRRPALWPRAGRATRGGVARGSDGPRRPALSAGRGCWSRLLRAPDTAVPRVAALWAWRPRAAKGASSSRWPPLDQGAPPLRPAVGTPQARRVFEPARHSFLACDRRPDLIST